MKRLRAVLLLAAAIFGFNAFSNGRSGEKREDAALSSNREVLVPAALVQEIETWYLKDFRTRKKGDPPSDVEVLSSVPRRLLNVALEITPKSGNAVLEPQQLRLPTGGGVVDLARSVEGEQGAFLVQMKLDSEVNLNHRRVFFVSGARKAKVMNEDYGAGCKTWMELTTWFDMTHAKEPLEVFAAQQRHARVLAGTWVFAALNEGVLHLAAVTLKDSRFPEIACN